MEFLPEKQRDARNIARYYAGQLAIRAFADEVRRHDPSRPISSGCAGPRASQFHQATTPPCQGTPWAADSFEQTATAASWTAPGPRGPPFDPLLRQGFCGLRCGQGAP